MAAALPISTSTKVARSPKVRAASSGSGCTRSEDVLKIVQQQFGLHDLAVEDAFRAHQRPKIEVFDETLFMVLRTAQIIEEKIEFGETHIFVGRGYVITVRHGASASYKDVRDRSEHTPQSLKHGEDFVLYAIMNFVVDNYMPIVDAVEERVEEIEDAVRSGAVSGETIERIAALRRDLLRVRRAASPLLDVCNRLQRMDLPCIDETIRPYYRDVHDHVIYVNESIDILRDMLSAAFETYLLLASNRQNEDARSGHSPVPGVGEERRRQPHPDCRRPLSRRPFSHQTSSAADGRRCPQTEPRPEPARGD